MRLVSTYIFLKEMLQELKDMGKWKHAAVAAYMFMVVVALLSGCGHGERTAGETKEPVPEYVLTYAENQADDYPTALGAYRFAQLVEERTGGRIQIQVSTGGTLGDERAVIEQLQFGGIDFARVSLSPLSEFVPHLNVLQMPYLYNDSEHMWRVLEGPIGDEFLECVDSVGVTALSWYDAGARNFYNSRRPIETVEDVKGMRIRVQESELMEAMVEALGGEALKLVYGEVYSALQTGAIDGAENNWPSYESERHYEVAPYYTVDEHTRVPEMQLVSAYTWNKLTEEDQEIIRACARESAVYERKLWAERSQASEEKIRRSGCVVTELSADEKRRFQEAMMPVYQKFCEEDMDVIDAIVAEGK